MTRRFSEYVSPGHPDKCADYISEYILDRYIEKDPSVRYAVEVMIKGNMVHLAGEVTSKVCFGYGDYKRFVKEALREIGYTEAYYAAWEGKVINPEEIDLEVDITAQSPEIAQGVDSMNLGWGDQGIFFGYADPDAEYMTPRSHSLAKDLCYFLYCQAKNKGIGGIDIKTEIILDENGNIEKIIAAVPCRSDNEQDVVYNSINTWFDTVVGNKPGVGIYWPQVILNGTGSYVMHGPVADCGITGRKLVVDFYGGDFQVGGGAVIKDGTKADVSLNLYARKMAKNWAYKIGSPVKVALACCIGRAEVDYSIEVPCGDVIESGKKVLSPRKLIKDLGLDKPIYASMHYFGLFGKYQQDKEWEKID